MEVKEEWEVQGILDILKHQYQETGSNSIREWVEAYMNAQPCKECKGGRLKKENLAIRLVDEATGARHSIADVVSLPIVDAVPFFKSLRLSERQSIIAETATSSSGTHRQDEYSTVLMRSNSMRRVAVREVRKILTRTTTCFAPSSAHAVA